MGFSRVSKLGSTLTLEHFLLVGEEVDEEIWQQIEEGKGPSLLPLRLIKGEEKNNLADTVVQFRCEAKSLIPLKNRMLQIKSHAEFVDLVLQLMRVIDDCSALSWPLDNLHLSRDGFNFFFDQDGEVYAVYWPLKKNRFKNDAWDFFFILPYMMSNEVLRGDRFFELYWNRIQQYRHEPFSTQRLMDVLSQANQTQSRGEFLPREIHENHASPSPASVTPASFEGTEVLTGNALNEQIWRGGTELLSSFDSTVPVNFTEFAGTEINSEWGGTEFLNSSMSVNVSGGTEILDANYDEGTELLDHEASKAFGIQMSNDGMRQMHFRKNDGQVLPMYSPSVVLGSSSEKADIVITGNKKISRSHARVVYRSGNFYITDLDSKNGTFIDGQRLDPQREYPLTVPCRLQLANCDLIFERA